LPGAVTGLFLEFAVGRLDRCLAGIHATLDQAQLVAVHAGSVFAHQQHRFVVEHRHHHHRAVAAADLALELAALAVGEFKIQALDAHVAGTVLGDAMDDGQLAVHVPGLLPDAATLDIMCGCRTIISGEC